MVQITGTYQHIKNENLVEYLVSIGFDTEKAKHGDSIRAQLTIDVDGKKITLSTDASIKDASVLILDEEVDEPMPGGIVLKSTAKLNGDTLTVFSKTPEGKKGVRTYKFTDTDLVVTMEDEDKKGPVGKRFFKRV